MDFAGPVLVKGSSAVKAYMVLFTCAVIRAIHLELCRIILMAFRRFVSRRGLPSVVYAHNGLAFDAASHELKAAYRLLHSFQVQDYCSTNHITCKFIAEHSRPWLGGFSEWMIQPVKCCLQKTLGKGCFHFEQLATILTPVENAIYPRPSGLTEAFPFPHR